MLKFLVIFLLSLMTSFPSYAASFMAKVNRNPVPLGETFVLTLQYEGTPGNSEPDLSPLNKDFNVHSVGRSAQHHNINGVTSNIYQWNIMLSPKISPQAVIPEIKFKNLSSKPITIKISDETSSGTSVPKFSIGRTVNKNNPFVQEQIIYTLVIKTTEEIQGDLPRFTDTDNGEWIIKQLDTPKVSSELSNGIETRNITINYALFPQKSGNLKIPELHFNGYYIDKNKSRRSNFSDVFSAFWDESLASGFGVNPALTRISLTAKPVDIHVLPIPDNIKGQWWLPSNKVKLVSDWNDKIPQLKVGEAVNRKIKLIAEGVADTQLPKLSFTETADIKQYPEPPEYKSIVIDNGIVSEMSVNVVYIPQQSGQITIPAITVPWYNTNTKSTEKAVLPSISVNVSGTPILFDTPEKTSTTNSTMSDIDTQLSETTKPSYNNIPYKIIWGVIALAFSFGLLISWLVLHFYHSSNNENSTRDDKPKKVNLNAIQYGKDLKEIRNEVIAWARSCHQDREILNLNDVATIFDDKELSKILQQLGASLYSDQSDKFNTTALYSTIKRLSKKQISEKKSKSPLPELYK